MERREKKLCRGIQRAQQTLAAPKAQRNGTPLAEHCHNQSHAQNRRASCVLYSSVMVRTTEECLTGKFLYGDDFTPELVQRWFEQEENAYFALAASGKPYEYSYHALHWEHGYKHIPRNKTFRKVLGVGSARGDEFDQIRHRCHDITILEPADGFKNPRAHYEKPLPDGSLPFPDRTFDLITCFGTLHHICTVSRVFSEMVRCLAPDGYLLTSEPMTSMGDWRQPRPGLSPNERGIPLPVFREMIEKSNLALIYQGPNEFRLLVKAALACGLKPFNSQILTKADALICALLPYRYHAKSPIEKFRPNSIAFVLHKATDLSSAT